MSRALTFVRRAKKRKKGDGGEGGGGEACRRVFAKDNAFPGKVA